MGGVAEDFARSLAGNFPLTLSLKGPSNSSPGAAPTILLLLTNQGPQLEPNSC